MKVVTKSDYSGIPIFWNLDFTKLPILQKSFLLGLLWSLFWSDTAILTSIYRFIEPSAFRNYRYLELILSFL